MPKSGWQWPWRRNPLRRSTDVLEAWLYLVTVLAVVVLAPAVGALTGLMLHGRLLGEAERQARERFPTTATLVPEPAPGRPWSSGPRSARGRLPARLHWTAPDGSQRDGTAGSVPREQIGAVSRVWTNAQGRLVGAPLGGDQASGRAIAGGAIAAAGVVMAQVAVRRGVLRRLERRRLEEWQREWERVGPRWSRRDT